MPSQGTSDAHSDAPAKMPSKKRNAISVGTKTRRFTCGRSLRAFRRSGETRREIEKIWDDLIEAFCNGIRKRRRDFEDVYENELPADWEDSLPKFEDVKSAATRAYSGEVINAIAGKLPQLFGGSADSLAVSTRPTSNLRTASSRPHTTAHRSFRRARTRDGQRDERNGALRESDSVRRHVFNFQRLYASRDSSRRAFANSDDLRFLRTIPSVSAKTVRLINPSNTFALRTIPNLFVIRPADAHETREAYRIAV